MSAPSDDRDTEHGPNGLSTHPSTTVHHGALPESWFPSRLLRWLKRKHIDIA